MLQPPFDYQTVVPRMRLFGKIDGQTQSAEDQAGWIPPFTQQRVPEGGRPLPIGPVKHLRKANRKNATPHRARNRPSRYPRGSRVRRVSHGRSMVFPADCELNAGYGQAPGTPGLGSRSTFEVGDAGISGGVRTVLEFGFPTVPTWARGGTATLHLYAESSNIVTTQVANVHGWDMEAIGVPFDEVWAGWIKATETVDWHDPGGDFLTDVLGSFLLAEQSAVPHWTEIDLSTWLAMDRAPNRLFLKMETEAGGKASTFTSTEGTFNHRPYLEFTE